MHFGNATILRARDNRVPYIVVKEGHGVVDLPLDPVSLAATDSSASIRRHKATYQQRTT
jgi:hypothetical protein